MIFGWFLAGLGGFWLVWVVFGWFGWFLAGLGGFWLVSNFSSNAKSYCLLLLLMIKQMTIL